MSVEAKIDKIIASQADFKTQQAVMATDMKHLIKDNIEFKDNLATLKLDYYKTKGVVEKHGIWFTIIHFLTVTLLGYIGYKGL